MKILISLALIIAIQANAQNNMARSATNNNATGSNNPQGAANYENFNDINSLTSWTMDNQSNPVGSNDWFQGNDLVFNAQSGATDAYIGANFSNTGNTGNTGTICNWLVMPDIGYIQTLSFWSRTIANSQFADHLVLLHSPTGGTNTGDCTNGFGDFTHSLIDINPSLATGGYPETWTQFTTNIDSTGVIAFVYYVSDAGQGGTNSNYIGIDTIDLIAGIPTSELSLSMSNNAAPVIENGQNVTFSQTLTNNGPHDAHNTSVITTIPTQLIYVANDCAATISGSTLTWDVGTLTPFSTVMCDVNFRLNGFETITLQATASADEIDNPADNTAVSSINGPVRIIPSLSGYGLMVLFLIVLMFGVRKTKNQLV